MRINKLCLSYKSLSLLIVLISVVNGQLINNEISANRSESRSAVGMTPWSQCFVEGAESVLNNVNTNCESRLSPISMSCQKAFENGCNYQRNSLLCAKGMENALNDKSCRQEMEGNNEEAFYTCCQFCFKGILEAFFAKRCAAQKNEGFLRKIQHQCCQRQEPILLSDRKLEMADDDDSKQCKSGFSLNHKTSKCEDVDECKLEMDNCEKGEVCFNTIGSFVCRKKIKCDQGFKQSISGFCVDINECQTKEHNCKKSNEVCRNRIGSFECECDVGFKRNRISEDCEDRNECVELFDACGATKICENTVGSFTCLCMPGFKDINGSCTDIDECVETDVCERCINTEGSYRCLSCPEGSHMIGNTCSPRGDNEKSQIVDDAVCTHKTFSAQCSEIICGRNYFKSPKADHVCIKKKKDSNPQHPLQISYAKVSVPSNVFIPKTGLSVYTIHRTKNEPLCEYWSSVIEAKDSRLATDEYWSFKFMDNSTTLKLLKSLKGPVEVRVTVDCKMNGFVLQRTIVIVYN